MMMTNPIKILLVEDESMWQQGIAALLATEKNLILTGIVDNADDAEVFFEADPPHVVLVDWKICGNRDGLELAKGLQQKIDSERIILVTGSPPEQIPPHPYCYVPKPQIASALIPTILSCAAHLTV
jgi:DNA-binding NarL/FixJ family response regulator